MTKSKIKSFGEIPTPFYIEIHMSFCDAITVEVQNEENFFGNFFNYSYS